jgi:hypothetical protein
VEARKIETNLNNRMKCIIITCHGGAKLPDMFLNSIKDKFPQFFNKDKFRYASEWTTNQSFIDELISFPSVGKGFIEIIEYDPIYKLVITEYDGFESYYLDLPYEQIIDDLVTYIKNQSKSYFVEQLLLGKSCSQLSNEATVKVLYPDSQ